MRRFKFSNRILDRTILLERRIDMRFTTSDNFIAVIAGALKEAINEIELLKSKNEELIERLLKIELNEGGKQ